MRIRKQPELIKTGLFFVLLFILSPSIVSPEEADVIIDQNSRAAKAVYLIEQAKQYIFEEDKKEMALLSLVQRNLTRKRIIKKRDTVDMEAEVLKYVSDTIYKTAQDDRTQIKVFGPKSKKEHSDKKQEETPQQSNQDRLKDIRKRILNDVKKKKLSR